MLRNIAIVACAVAAVAAESNILSTIDESISDPYEVIYADHELGEFLNVSSCSSAPSCGSQMASYNGVAAKSNGKSQCTGSCCGGTVTTGCAYQCVEYAQRYMHEKHGIIANWHKNANMMCSDLPSGISKTSSPQAGDLFVRTSGTWGHVAVISAVHSSTVDVVEQNSSPSGKNTYNKADAGCFLTAGHANNGKCHHLGYYCGNDGLNKNANKLYYCKGDGADPVLHTDCAFTCATMPQGSDDQCVPGSCSKVNTGNYCGDDKIGGHANTLYRCESSKPKGAEKCGNGCVTAPSGQNDYCK